MTLSRRSLLRGFAAATGLASFSPRYAFCLVAAESTFKLPPQASWSSAQKEGHGRVMQEFRKCRVRPRHRAMLFEGLVYAVSQGHRERDPIAKCATEYLQKTYAEIPDWLKIVALVLQIIVALVTLLLLFI
jgi:hypothetical protein